MIRFAIESDLEDIVEIYNQTIPTRLSTADLEPVKVSDRLDWFRAHSSERYPVFVYEVEKQVVGWLSLRPFYGRLAYQITAEISVYVDQDYRGNRVASKLIDHAKSFSNAKGIENFVAFIFSHNLSSIRLFQYHGFVSWGELPEIAKMDGKLYSLSILGARIKIN